MDVGEFTLAYDNRESERQGGRESGTATQIIANIPLKGSEGSLWAPDKPALVKRGEREMTSAVLL